MAFSTASRTLGPSTKADVFDTGKTSTSNSLNVGFGQTSTPWGSSNIWGNGGLTSGFGSRATTRDSSMSRDLAAQKIPSPRDQDFDGRTGSGSLVDSSVRDDGSYPSLYSAQRSTASSRSISQVRYQDTSAGAASSGPRSMSNAGIVLPSLATHQGPSAYTVTRPPAAISLNTISPTLTRQSFGTALASGLSGRAGEAPPNVYTKFDRPADPMQYKKPDSAIGSFAEGVNLPSPTDERKAQYSGTLRSISVPSSRERSLPPSSHSNDRPFFSQPDYGRSTQQMTPASSRAPSISSQRNGGQNGDRNGSTGWNTEAMTVQFGQMRFAPSAADARVPPQSYKQTTHQPNFAINGQPAWHLNNGNGNPSQHDDALYDNGEEVPRFQLSRASQRSNLPSPGHVQPFTPSTFDPSYAYIGANTPLGLHDVNGNGTQRTLQPLNAQWSSYVNEAQILNRMALALAQPYPMQLSPQYQQLLNAQFAQQGAGNLMYGAFAMPDTVQHVAPSLYPAMHAYETPAHARAGPTPNVQVGFRSRFLDEFLRTYKLRPWVLAELKDHIEECAVDKDASRFIQQGLESAKSDVKGFVFDEILPSCVPLMMDVFANYVVQKFFELGEQRYKDVLLKKMKGSVLMLSSHDYGCRVVQSALASVLTEQKLNLVKELEGHVLQCVENKNGNHVIQQAIRHCPRQDIDFIIDAFRGRVHQLSVSAYGCRVIQRCLEQCDERDKSDIISELIEGMPSIIVDQYGNYVVQHIVQYDVKDGPGRARVLDIVARSLESHSKHKFASNVVEKCLQYSDDVWRRRIVDSFFSRPDVMHGRGVEGESALVGMIKDSYANYVVQKLLKTLNDGDYRLFLEVLRPALQQARRTGGGKQLAAVEEKMQRLDHHLDHRQVYNGMSSGVSNGTTHGMSNGMANGMAYTSGDTVGGAGLHFDRR